MKVDSISKSFGLHSDKGLLSKEFQELVPMKSKRFTFRVNPFSIPKIFGSHFSVVMESN